MGRLEKNIIHAMGTKDLMEYIYNVNKKKRKTQNWPGKTIGNTAILEVIVGNREREWQRNIDKEN